LADEVGALGDERVLLLAKALDDIGCDCLGQLALDGGKLLQKRAQSQQPRKARKQRRTGREREREKDALTRPTPTSPRAPPWPCP